MVVAHRRCAAHIVQDHAQRVVHAGHLPSPTLRITASRAVAWQTHAYQTVQVLLQQRVCGEYLAGCDVNHGLLRAGEVKQLLVHVKERFWVDHLRH